MSANHKRPNYTKEFKEEAVNLVLKHGYTCHEAGRRLGIAPSNATRWVRLHKQEKKEIAETGTTTRELEAENRRLRKENLRLQMERDILKKAAAFFAKESE